MKFHILILDPKKQEILDLEIGLSIGPIWRMVLGF